MALRETLGYMRWRMGESSGAKGEIAVLAAKSVPAPKASASGASGPAPRAEAKRCSPDLKALLAIERRTDDAHGLDSYSHANILRKPFLRKSHHKPFHGYLWPRLRDELLSAPGSSTSLRLEAFGGEGARRNH